MSSFTPGEIVYLQSQRLGRLATVGPDGQPHVVPVSFRYNRKMLRMYRRIPAALRDELMATYQQQEASPQDDE